jgi:hypothetical protein
MAKKIIWLKKAKCAGTSLEKALQEKGVIYYVHPDTSLKELESSKNIVICIREALFPYGKTLLRSGDDNYKLNDASTLIYRLRAKLGVPFRPLDFMISRYPDFFFEFDRFAVIRNPYDKFISSWRYLNSMKNLSIDEVITNLPTPGSLHDWVHISQLQVEAISHTRRMVANKLLYMESDMESDLKHLLASVGLGNIDLPKENRSRRGKATEYLTPDIAQKIYCQFRPDFEAFGYDEDFLIQSPLGQI